MHTSVSSCPYTNISFLNPSFSACDGCPSQVACSSGQFNRNTSQDEQETLKLQTALSNVSNVVLVLSGKGGVGKVCDLMNGTARFLKDRCRDS
jgi:hypothetical protein